MLAQRFGRSERRGDGAPTMHRSAGQGGEVLLRRTAGDRGPCRSDSRTKGDRYPKTSQSLTGHLMSSKGQRGREANDKGPWEEVVLNKTHLFYSLLWVFPLWHTPAKPRWGLVCSFIPLCDCHKHNWTALVEPTTPGQGHGQIHGQVIDTEALQGLQMHRKTRSTHMENE